MEKIIKLQKINSHVFDKFIYLSFDKYCLEFIITSLRNRLTDETSTENLSVGQNPVVLQWPKGNNRLFKECTSVLVCNINL